MNKLDALARDLPDPEAALRFYTQFEQANPRIAATVGQNPGLLSDLLALSSYSPLLAATLIQNPEYALWLGKERSNLSVRSKDEILESLARFSMTQTQASPHVLFARFRRRELLRIFLKDIRQLGTVAEITEEISNLADAILENGLRFARQQIDNRFGPPFEADENGRRRPADICVVSLGKLGSKELNYSSDIDLLFIYSAEGATTGRGPKGVVSNREYFIKVAESVIALIGKQGGEGAAYRVDMRLRPHGRVGSIALSLGDTVRYYLTEARGWEQQVLIRSRASAGNPELFKEFRSSVEEVIFRPGRDVGQALQEVYSSKQKIDTNRRDRSFIDVKLDAGGIREIEFIAQALQLAYGGTDSWLRAAHTLISISRLADRRLLSETDRSELSNAYAFLRRLEHLLQMEHGLQTHSVPTDAVKIELTAKRLRCANAAEFKSELSAHMGRVHSVFERLFRDPYGSRHDPADAATDGATAPRWGRETSEPPAGGPGMGTGPGPGNGTISDDQHGFNLGISELSPRFEEFLAPRPWLREAASFAGGGSEDYAQAFSTALDGVASGSDTLRELRRTWSGLVAEIYLKDLNREIAQGGVRRRLTSLAEASLAAAAGRAANDLLPQAPENAFEPIIVALGKLGSGTLDYDSDLDLVFGYSTEPDPALGQEMYGRGIESMLNLLSSITRDGNLYRVDLRLRPHGKSGPLAIGLDKVCEYLRRDAAVWELLAYAQMRVLGTGAKKLTRKLRGALVENAASVGREEIRREAKTIRARLEAEHAPRRAPSQDFKFGAGGLMDIYFATRYLSLVVKGHAPGEAYSTSARLEALAIQNAISPQVFQSFSRGHAFLSDLDHSLRLFIGRTSRLPRSDRALLEKLAGRMGLRSAAELEEQLSIHRICIREAFDEVMGE